MASRSILIDTVNEALESAPADSDLASRFMASSGDTLRYVVGRNDQSAELIGKFEIKGLVDDYNRGDGHWLGVPVVSSVDVPANAIVANCSTSISPIDVVRNLQQAGLRDIVSFGDLLKIAPDTLSIPWFVSQQRDDMERHLSEWSELYAAMADDQSRQTLLDVVRFRSTADPRYMQDYAVRLSEQYFESFLDPARQVFVDAGGYDGDTTEEFCRRYPDYLGVFLFEPSAVNMTAARKRLSGMRDIIFYEAGLSDSQGMLHFNAHAGPASSVTQDQGETIAATTLDHAIQVPVTFIKMDLEGWEIKALHGSKRIIEQHTPQLAIAVYHRASDFREIAKYVRALNPAYRMRLRHYTQGWSETVMFFTPHSTHG